MAEAESDASTETRQLFQRLKREAECPVCSKTVQKPKSLPCLHSFCLECLNRLASTAREEGKTAIECTVCLSSVKIPEGGKFEDFPTSFHLSRLVDILALEDADSEQQICGNCEVNNKIEVYCFECQMFLCAECVIPHGRFKFTRDHRSVSIRDLNARTLEELIQRPVMCEEKNHQNEQVEYFCQDCKVCICEKCVIGPHRVHTIVEIPKAVEKSKIKIVEGVEKLKTRVSECEEEIQKGAENFKITQQNYIATRNAIHKNVADAILQLKLHEQDVLCKLDNIGNEQQSEHAEHLEKHDSRTALLRGLLEYGEHAIQGPNNPVVLGSQIAVMQQCQQVLSAEEDQGFNPRHVEYVVNGELAEIVKRSVGQIVLRITDPTKCVAEGDGLKEAKAGSEALFTVITRDSEGKDFYCADDQVRVTIRSPTGEELEKRIDDNKDGKYTVTYATQHGGQHQVAVEVNGKPLTRSPWRVQVD